MAQIITLKVFHHNLYDVFYDGEYVGTYATYNAAQDVCNILDDLGE